MKYKQIIIFILLFFIAFLIYNKLNTKNFTKQGEAMENPNSKNRNKYTEIRKMNLHKMEAIPVCKIPN